MLWSNILSSAPLSTISVNNISINLKDALFKSPSISNLPVGKETGKNVNGGKSLLSTHNKALISSWQWASYLRSKAQWRWILKIDVRHDEWPEVLISGILVKTQRQKKNLQLSSVLSIWQGIVSHEGEWLKKANSDRWKEQGIAWYD